MGYYIGTKSHIVTIQIENSSQKNISAVVLEHEKGTATRSDIQQKKRKKMNFYSSAENSYKLNVIFEDNTSLYSEKRHVKPGSRVIESVFDDEIKAVF
jgi:hypothetical protein